MEQMGCGAKYDLCLPPKFTGYGDLNQAKIPCIPSAMWPQSKAFNLCFWFLSFFNAKFLKHAEIDGLI